MRISPGRNSAHLDLGVPADEFPALWLEARQSALDAAIADGVITPEDADWILSRMQAGGRGTGAMGATQTVGRGQGGVGAGASGQGGGMRGFGEGAGTGACLWE